MGMMNDDKKKMATLILGFGKGDKKSEDGEKPSEPSEESSSTAGDVLSAIKSGDEKAFKGALKAFVYECMNESQGDDEDDTEY